MISGDGQSLILPDEGLKELRDTWEKAGFPLAVQLIDELLRWRGIMRRNLVIVESWHLLEPSSPLFRDATEIKQLLAQSQEKKL